MLDSWHLINPVHRYAGGTLVGQKTVRFSDFSGELITRLEAYASRHVREAP